jgi:BirA family biotin operon repressor/biotin-[acetyl-CoA-carboxylase] ligase
MFAASLNLARVLRDAYGVDARLKWPNDVLADGRKVCGMLSEMEAEGEWVRFVNLGIGINVNNDPAALAPQAVALQQLLGKPVGRGDLLRRFLKRFSNSLNTGLGENLLTDWKALCVTLGQNVRIVTPRHVIAGRAVDLDIYGALVLQQPDGGMHHVAHGDCFHDDRTGAQS